MESDTPNRESGIIAKKAVGAYTTALSQCDHLDWSVVENYLPLVKSMVARMRIYFPGGTESEDLYSIALTGLISAVRNYDSAKGKHFGAYAKLRIRGALLDELRKIDWLSRDERQRAKSYNENVQELEQRLNRPPTEQEICSELGISKQQRAKIEEMKKPVRLIPLTMSQGVEGESSTMLQDLISDPTEQDGRDLAQNHELIEILKDKILDLEITSRRVLLMYYLEGMRLAEIATVLDLTESRICQIHGSALAQLRRQLIENMSK